MGYFTDDNRAAERYVVDARVKGNVDGQAFEGDLKDISVTGAAITGMPQAAFENNQFVEMHMEGLGHRQGYVARRIPEGFALQFEASEDEEKRKREFQEAIRALGPGALRG